MIDHGYEAMMKGGAQQFGGLLKGQDGLGVEMSEYTTHFPQKTEKRRDSTAVSAYKLSDGIEVSLGPSIPSWVQSLAYLHYEDLISAHTVKTFVLLIPIREPLLPNGHSIFADPVSDRAHHQCIITGRHLRIFPRSSEKAGLNMITDVEAAVCFQLATGSHEYRRTRLYGCSIGDATLGRVSNRF